MKTVILAGGFGTRLSEETITKPKPMVSIGGRPILWHLMKIYSYFGLNDFIICCGYKGYVIKEYFANYFLHESDVTFDFKTNSMEVHQKQEEPWRVTLVDTGYGTLTGGRLKRIRKYLDPNESFCLTYGDGLSDINIKDLIDYHHKQGVQATLTAINPPGRFGALEISEDRVSSFKEKSDNTAAWINGGFFVLEPSVIDLIEGDATSWESTPLLKLTAQGQLASYKHTGFWKAMDTLREKNSLNEMWESGNAPWKIW